MRDGGGGGGAEAGPSHTQEEEIAALGGLGGGGGDPYLGLAVALDSVVEAAQQLGQAHASRELSLAITNAQQAAMWARAASAAQAVAT